MQRFGEKLRHLRERQGMTIRGLAQALGFANHSYIARIEKGEAKPSLDMVGKVARLFQVSFDQLMDDEIEKSQARLARIQRNHIGLALPAFLRLEASCFYHGLSWFAAKQAIVRRAVAAYLAQPCYTLPCPTG